MLFNRELVEKNISDLDKTFKVLQKLINCFHP